MKIYLDTEFIEQPGTVELGQHSAARALAGAYRLEYEVEKFHRDGQARWSACGARRSLIWLNNGTRIDLRERAGRRVIATAGGLLDPVREVAS